MFQIDLKSRKSIYQQVVDNIKGLIIKGTLKENDKLPSVRELSKILLINPNTVSKAYRALEHEGYIYTTNGLGTFVAELKSKKEVDARLSEIKKQIAFYVEELFYSGLGDKEATDFVQEIIKERGKNK